MDLEQVKEHFKYAKEVRCLGKSIYEGHLYEIDLSIIGNGDGNFRNDVYCATKNGTSNGDCLLYNSKTNQLAEILTYVFERGEEVEVSDSDSWWVKRKFIGFDLKGNPITEHIKENDVVSYKHIRKLQPQSLLEPELTALKDKAKAKEKGMNVTVIFENNV